MKKKIVAAALACILCIGVGIGGTLAWLTSETGEVTNTFTVGDINITLQEHVYAPETNSLTSATTTTNSNYKYVPGDTMPKDPYVTVQANSEACWVFVKVTETNNTATGLTGNVINWAVAEGWTQVTGKNVWYKQVSATTADSEPMYILANNQVTVNTGVTKAMVSGLTSAKPVLTFDAYAHQVDNTNLTDATNAALAHWGLN